MRRRGDAYCCGTLQAGIKCLRESESGSGAMCAEQSNCKGREKRRFLLLLWICAAICLVAATVIYVIWEPVTVSFLDVGQGDACLVQAGRNGAVLIDGGDTGEGETLRGYFRVQNVKCLDGIFISHFHEDHASGVLELLESGFPVKRLYIPKTNSGTGLEERVFALAEAQGIPVQRLGKADTLTLGRMRYEVLWPGEDGQNLDLNNASMVLRLNFGDTALLFTGDIEAPAARRLAAEAEEDIRAEVLKVPHHGGSSSVQRSFLEACGPKWAVVSAGTDNQYRDPSDNMLSDLLENGTGIWRTDRDGTVVMTLGEHGIKRVEHSNKWR